MSSRLLDSMQEGRVWITKEKLDSPEFEMTVGDNVVKIGNVLKQKSASDLDPPEIGNSFVTVTSNGAVTIWNEQVKQVEICTKLCQVSTGEVLLKDDEGSTMEGLIILQSRQLGIHFFKFSYTTFLERLEKLSTFDFECHVGFCKLSIAGDSLIFPIHQCFFGLIKLPTLLGFVKAGVSAPQSCKTPAPGGCIMFLRVLTTEQGQDFIVFGMEDGRVNVSSTFSPDSANDDSKTVFWDDAFRLNDCRRGLNGKVIQIGVPTKDNEEELITPLCVEYRRKTALAIVGTNTKALYLLKLDFERKQIAFEGRRSLMYQGVNSMHLHNDGKLLAIGGWDGVVRILALPFMSQLISIEYHKAAISNVLFLNNFNPDSDKKYHLVCGDELGQVTCWNLKEKIQKCES